MSVSQDHAIALQPGQQEQNSVSKKKKNQHLFLSVMIIFESQCRLGMVVHACHPSTLGGSLEARSPRPDWPTWQNPISTKQKLARHGGVPVFPATQEAEAGELLEPGRWRLQ